MAFSLLKSPGVQYLEQNGIRPILNYAAEDDVSEEPEEATSCPHAAAERCLDRNMAIFMRSIRDSDNIRNRAFVAIKVAPVHSPVSAAEYKGWPWHVLSCVMRQLAMPCSENGAAGC